MAEHPSAGGRDLLRHHAVEKARRPSPEELQHSKDIAYTSAVKLTTDLVKAKRQLHVLLAL